MTEIVGWQLRLDGWIGAFYVRTDAGKMEIQECDASHTSFGSDGVGLPESDEREVESTSARLPEG